MAQTVRKKRSVGAKNRSRGIRFEQKIINELKDLSNDQEICSSRSESKKLDNSKIDIYDPNHIFPCYFQLKSTQKIPNIKSINEEVKKKDLPLCIIWSAQESRETNQVSVGEYAIMPKDLFYYLLKLHLNKNEQ